MHLSRWSLAAATAALAALALVGTADAQVPFKLKRPRLAVIDRGAQVEIVVSDIRLPAAPTMKVNRERIELPLAGRPVEVNDSYPVGLVMRIDVRSEGLARTLSVKLRRDHDAVVALANGAVARQEDDGVHLLVPKAPGAPVSVPVLVPVPEKTAATTEATATPPDPDPNPNPTASSNPNPNPTANPNASSDDRNALAALQLPGTGTGTGSAKPAKLTGGDGGGPGIGRVVLAIGAIGLAGLALVFLRRRRGLAPTAAGPQLELLASRSLGGKHRIVWLGAGERELVIAVGGPRVELLGTWPRNHDVAPAPLRLEPVREREREPELARERDDSEPRFAAGSTSIPRTRTLNTNTPAVSGIMRLRGRLPQLADDVATDDRDADEQWARDILAASGARR